MDETSSPTNSNASSTDDQRHYRVFEQGESSKAFGDASEINEEQPKAKKPRRTAANDADPDGNKRVSSVGGGDCSIASHQTENDS